MPQRRAVVRGVRCSHACARAANLDGEALWKRKHGHLRREGCVRVVLRREAVEHSSAVAGAEHAAERAFAAVVAVVAAVAARPLPALVVAEGLVLKDDDVGVQPDHDKVVNHALRLVLRVHLAVHAVAASRSPPVRTFLG